MCEMNDPEITPEEKAERIGEREREIADERTAQRRDDMTNDSISNTPLTDAAMIERSRINGPPNSGADTGAKGFDYVVTVEFARGLEKENQQLKVLINELLVGAVSASSVFSVCDHDDGCSTCLLNRAIKHAEKLGFTI